MENGQNLNENRQMHRQEVKLKLLYKMNKSVCLFFIEYWHVNQRYEGCYGPKFHQQYGESTWNGRSNTNGTDDVASTGR